MQKIEESTGNKMKSEKIDLISIALMNFQSECPPIIKTKKGGGGTKVYKYAPLESILAIVTPIMKKNGLVASQSTQQVEGGFALNTLLMHISGQWLDSNLPLDTSGTEQEKGSSQTYNRRYGLCGLLGIASEDDDDGQSATDKGSHITSSAATPPNTSKAHLPPCEACGAVLKLGRYGYFCPDNKKPLDPNSDKPKHTSFTEDKIEEYKTYLAKLNGNGDSAL